MDIKPLESRESLEKRCKDTGWGKIESQINLGGKTKTQLFIERFEKKVNSTEYTITLSQGKFARGIGIEINPFIYIIVVDYKGDQRAGCNKYFVVGNNAYTDAQEKIKKIIEKIEEGGYLNALDRKI